MQSRAVFGHSRLRPLSGSSVSLLALLPLTSSALELSDIRVYSHLNEPLVAEVPLLLQQQDTAGEFSLGLVFSGASLPGDSVQSKGDIQTRTDGSRIIRIETRTPIKQVAFDLEVDVRGGSSASRRTYHLTLPAVASPPIPTLKDPVTPASREPEAAPPSVPTGETAAPDSANNAELATRLDRIEHTLVDLQNTLKNTQSSELEPTTDPSENLLAEEASAHPATTATAPLPAETLAPSISSESGATAEQSPQTTASAANTTDDTHPATDTGSFWRKNGVVILLQLCMGLGVALMGVALGLVIRRRQPEARLTVKIAVNGQRRDDAGLPETFTLSLPETPPSTEDKPSAFLDAADYGLMPLVATDNPNEGEYLSAQNETRPKDDIAGETAPPGIQDDAIEKTIDDILRELTGQMPVPDDPIHILDQASGDYTRNQALKLAIEPRSPGSKTPAKTQTETEYGDLTDMDEFETLLDLARAYIAMDEYDSARELLLDVEAKGTESQQAEARRWLVECPSRHPA